MALESIKKSMQERDTAQALSRDQDDWRAYEHHRNTATAKVRTKNRIWVQHELDSAQHNSSTIWSNIKTRLSWGNTGPPTKLLLNGEILTSPARLAGAMNNSFFSDKSSHY